MKIDHLIEMVDTQIVNNQETLYLLKEMRYEIKVWRNFFLNHEQVVNQDIINDFQELDSMEMNNHTPKSSLTTIQRKHEDITL